MTDEEIEAIPEWYLNRDKNFWIDKHIKSIKSQSAVRTEREKHHFIQFALTAALLTLFGALCLVILARICMILWSCFKRFCRKNQDPSGMQFNTGSEVDEDEDEDEEEDDDDEEDVGRGLETRELDRTDANVDAIEMDRIDRRG